MEEQSNEALWYVVHTYSGYENKVANDLQTMVENRHLQDLICDIKVPVEMVPEIDKNGKQKMVEHKLFPGYVLVKMVMNDDTRLFHGLSAPNYSSVAYRYYKYGPLRFRCCYHRASVRPEKSRCPGRTMH